ncbi:hypothetical protein SAMN05444273_107126 [Litoreibacter ascidiaceicola]|uniref:CHAD domain-containing protein n=1 Tax=Litoreibacter ascidiaceicola TaxID=1486859 RepID=A0A1M5CH56_9RHOB|nr:hypothetical protein [Litoreibacter ascidiaceicola]SHF54010.1 hypothetical protein SAMN05444273_107126 [Litoreibacter ascidiaceicola]
MTDRTTDPLALRHGPLIAQIWGQIAEARNAARQSPTQDRATFWLRRIRHLRRQVLTAHKLEMTRHDASTPAIDGWFQPVTSTLDRAEAHFAAHLAATALAQNQKTAAAR